MPAASSYFDTVTAKVTGTGAPTPATHHGIPIISSIVDRVGYAFPLAVLFFVYLFIKYPNRLVTSHPARPGVNCLPGLPLLGNTITLIRRGVSCAACHCHVSQRRLTRSHCHRQRTNFTTFWKKHDDQQNQLSAGHFLPTAERSCSIVLNT